MLKGLDAVQSQKKKGSIEPVKIVHTNILAEFVFSDICVEYVINKIGSVGLQIFPVSLKHKVKPHRTNLAGLREIDVLPATHRPQYAYSIDSLVQLKCVEDAYSDGMSQGVTLRNSDTVASLRYESQSVHEHDGFRVVKTRMVSTHGWYCDHFLSHHLGEDALEVWTEFENTSAIPAQLEMLASCSLGGITPFDNADACDRLMIHRFKSRWSAEGRFESRTIEEMHLERSWHCGCVACERFGQVGSLPVRGYFPFVAIEDMREQVLWGMQLAYAGSWQFEIYRKDDCVAVSAGLGDREFAHWLKRIKVGERFVTPKAIIGVCHGGIESLCERLTGVQKRYIPNSDAETELPVIFNEWCTSWGNPSEANLLKIANRLVGTGIKYLVIDAGWYKKNTSEWNGCHGDWVPNEELYPQGLKVACGKIRKLGLIPGIWFELETLGPDSEAYHFSDHLLRRDGKVLESGKRRFWDFRDPFTFDYLNKKVIGLIENCGIGYIKIDYNETIGIGVDGAESLGEGLREHLEAVKQFFIQIRKALPDIFIESCASGGHRLEPSILALSDVGSFSDAHEIRSLPIIAANLHRLIQPRQSLVWAVLRTGDSNRRLAYTLSSAFLGRMCLSGDICDLGSSEWEALNQALNLYRKTNHIIANGSSRRFGTVVSSYNDPKGWQCILRVHANKKELLAVIHTFDRLFDEKINIELPVGEWVISDMFGVGVEALITPGEPLLACRLLNEFSAVVVHIRSKGLQ
jgi:alpha-galactosidase